MFCEKCVWVFRIMCTYKNCKQQTIRHQKLASRWQYKPHPRHCTQYTSQPPHPPCDVDQRNFTNKEITSMFNLLQQNWGGENLVYYCSDLIFVSHSLSTPPPPLHPIIMLLSSRLILTYFELLLKLLMGVSFVIVIIWVSEREAVTSEYLSCW